jgi:hypothetical protein
MTCAGFRRRLIARSAANHNINVEPIRGDIGVWWQLPR